MGRDSLFDLMAAHKLLVRKRKRKIQTTNSKHWLKKYPNLIKDVVPSRVNEIWVADITYFKIKKGNVYISFITDAYSKKIVGYYLAETLEAINSVKALQMALDQNNISTNKIIHHSDRGVQYCSEEYVRILHENQILISMTESGDPLDNPIAERINGIIKDEYLNHYQLNNKKEVEKKLNESILLYNSYRPHLSCNMLTPSDVHQNNLPVKRLWKNYYKQKTKFLNLS
jgi:transposase InsO family protein